jgi:hypothetical protein
MNLFNIELIKTFFLISWKILQMLWTKALISIKTNQIILFSNLVSVDQLRQITCRVRIVSHLRTSESENKLELETLFHHNYDITITLLPEQHKYQNTVKPRYIDHP